jgi:hypothetical protein
MSETPEQTTTGTDLVPRAQAHLASPTTPPREWAVMVQQAEFLAKSDIIPKAFRFKPANIVAAALAGRAYNWDVMTAMLNGHVIEGRYGVSPEAQLGLIRQAGHSVTKADAVKGESVTARGRRADTGDTAEVTWTMADAKAANLHNKDNWKHYPDAMLWARAVSALATQLFSDVTLGLARYTDEEIEGEWEGDAIDVVMPREAPPVGWESWDECDEEHDAYLERWRAAPEEAQQAVLAFTREHESFRRPMTRAQLNALDAKLVQAAENVSDESGLGAGGTIPTGHSEDDVSAATPVVDPAPVAAEASSPDEAIEDAVVVGEEAEAPAATAAPAPAPSPAADPAPGELASPGEVTRMATLVSQWFLPAERDQARHAVATIVSNGRTASTRQLRGDEAREGIKVVKAMQAGTLVFGVVKDDDSVDDLGAYGVPPEGSVPTLLASAPEGQTTEAGEKLLDALEAFLGAS